MLVAVRLWAVEWAGLKVILYCDNWSVVCATNSGVANEPLLRGIIRELWWLCATHDIYLVVRHRPGANMMAADLLSRASNSPACRQRLLDFKAKHDEPERVIAHHLLMPPLCI